MTYEELAHHEVYLAESLNNVAAQRVAFVRHALLICATVLGLIVGLLDVQTCDLFVRWVAGATIVFLSVGLLAGGIALHGMLIEVPRRAHQSYLDEISRALREGDSVQTDISVSAKSIHGVCERIFYIFSSLAMLCLVARAIATVVQ